MTFNVFNPRDIYFAPVCTDLEKKSDQNLRSALNLHRSDLIVAPAHGSQRGVVIVYLPLASCEVLLLEQHDLGLLMLLGAYHATKDSVQRCSTLHSRLFMHTLVKGKRFLQQSRQGGRTSSSQCGKRCCHSTTPSEGTLLSPAQTAAHRNWSARIRPSCRRQADGAHK